MDWQLLYIKPEKKRKKTRNHRREPSWYRDTRYSASLAEVFSWMLELIQGQSHSVAAFGCWSCSFSSQSRTPQSWLLDHSLWVVWAPPGPGRGYSWEPASHTAPLPREQFEPRDAQATGSGHLTAPLVEKYQLNLWLLVLRSELIGRENVCFNSIY